MAYFRYVLVWQFCIALIFAGNVCQEKSSTNGPWTCQTNPDTTLNVTYDCLGNQTAREIHIWSFDFPEDMGSLTIQNCASITLKVNRLNNQGKTLPDFKFLKVVNVTKLTLPFFHLEDFAYFSPYRGCVPANVLFENVGLEELDMPLCSSECDKLGIFFKSMEVKNVTVKVLKEVFTTHQSLRKLTFDRVTVESAEKNAFKIGNEKSIVKIINSSFESVDQNFMALKVSEVMFSGNVIENYDDQNIFSLEAEKVTIKDNRFKKLTDKTLKIISNNIIMTGNTFHRVDEHVLDDTSPKNLAMESSLDFSNNKIHSLASESLAKKHGHNETFLHFKLSNNSIDCICQNIFWFDWIFRNKLNVGNYSAYKWAKAANLNKCLNIPDCKLSQVLENYHDLCEPSYQCPQKSISDKGIALHVKHNDYDSLQDLFTSLSFLYFTLCMLYVIWALEKIKLYLKSNSQLRERRSVPEADNNNSGTSNSVV